MDQSFRFGPEIAYVSALLLRTLKGVRRKTLVGTTDSGMIVFISSRYTRYHIRENFRWINKPSCYLCIANLVEIFFFLPMR
jgi:hypothetical protein